jgi:hypothetical protein
MRSFAALAGTDVLGSMRSRRVVRTPRVTKTLLDDLNVGAAG